MFENAVVEVACGDDMEARESMISRGKRELEKAADFRMQPDRKAMALGCARTAVLIFLQLGEGFEQELAQARRLVEELELDVANQKANAFEQELSAVRAAAIAWGVATKEEVETEKLGRLQEGLWIAFAKKADLNLWDRQGNAQRRNMDPALGLVVNAVLLRMRAIDGVEDIAMGEVLKVYDSEAVRWVVKLSVRAVWGKRSFSVVF